MCCGCWKSHPFDKNTQLGPVIRFSEPALALHFKAGTFASIPKRVVAHHGMSVEEFLGMLDL
jgi:hypothetical protein